MLSVYLLKVFIILSMKNKLWVFFAAVTLISCNKEPGKGGTSTISGKIYRYEVNALGEVLDEYYVSDKNIYIIYGNDDMIYDDKFSTSLDGSYEFKNLVKGKYTLFTYSRCDTCPGGDEAVTMEVEITKNKENIILDDFITYK